MSLSFVLCVGTVPVYLGDANSLRSFLPHPKAAIFVADFNSNYTSLANYLNYLMTNESAYEEHRSWRHIFSNREYIKDKPLLQSTFECNVCKWAKKEHEKEYDGKNVKEMKKRIPNMCKKGI
jgi:hypothetical protein